MRKTGIMIIVAAALLAALFAGCGPSGAAVPLDQEFISYGGDFSLNAPDTWGYYDAVAQEDMVLASYNYDTAYASVFFYSSEYYPISLAEATDITKRLYGDNIIDDVRDLKVNGMDAKAFQYSMVDLSELGEEYNYHGLEYLIQTPLGIVEIDINYAQGKLEGKIFDPSKDDLELLARIAESLKVQ